jgi:hypothetical protein
MVGAARVCGMVGMMGMCFVGFRVGFVRVVRVVRARGFVRVIGFVRVVRARVVRARGFVRVIEFVRARGFVRVVRARGFVRVVRARGFVRVVRARVRGLIVIGARGLIGLLVNGGEFGVAFFEKYVGEPLVALCGEVFLVGEEVALYGVRCDGGFGEGVGSMEEFGCGVAESGVWRLLLQ